MKTAYSITLCTVLLSLVTLATPLGAATTIYEDTFTRANTSVSASSLGADWSVTGDVFINSNMAAAQPDKGIAIYQKATLSDEFSLAVTVRTLDTVSNLFSGVLFNYDAATKTGLAIRITTVNSSAGIQLVKYVDGTVTLINQSAIGTTLAQNTPYRITVKTTDTPFKYSYAITTSGDVSITSGFLTDTGSMEVKGQVGIYFGGGYVRGDNFSLEIPQPQVPEPSTFALFLGMLCVGFAGWLKLRRSR
ncbi:MAG: PEP-CTERM sorting domain-containing protein [Opitutaceae bacterium]|jgi:hypothetical protein|nr:PEP-CTERM sorting domain-containing protein [Opitutaceae bacterium]